MKNGKFGERGFVDFHIHPRLMETDSAAQQSFHRRSAEAAYETIHMICRWHMVQHAQKYISGNQTKDIHKHLKVRFNCFLVQI